MLIGLMGRGSGGMVKPIEGTNMYVIVVASIKDQKDKDGKSPVIVFYNLKLDVLLGDLPPPPSPPRTFRIASSLASSLCTTCTRVCSPVPSASRHSS